jgi:hypothetical protein
MIPEKEALFKEVFVGVKAGSGCVRKWPARRTGLLGNEPDRGRSSCSILGHDGNVRLWYVMAKPRRIAQLPVVSAVLSLCEAL